jgi:hypothetical protein
MDSIRRYSTSTSASTASATTTALEALVVCECGHPIGAHDSMGCRALRPHTCNCSRDRGYVLDAAIARSISDHRSVFLKD